MTGKDNLIFALVGEHGTWESGDDDLMAAAADKISALQALLADTSRTAAADLTFEQGMWMLLCEAGLQPSSEEIIAAAKRFQTLAYTEVLH